MTTRNDRFVSLSKNTMERFPIYYRALISLLKEIQYISSEELGGLCEVSGVQVRKDLAIFKNIGRPAIGYDKSKLIMELESFFGIRNNEDVALVGCGNLGKALIHFPGFDKIGIKLTLLFDSDQAKIDVKINGIKVHPIDKFKEYVKRANIRIGVITTPPSEAQKIGEMMEDSGIIYIRNFAPVTLKLSESVHVRDEDLSAGFLLASQYVKMNK